MPKAKKTTKRKTVTKKKVVAKKKAAPKKKVAKKVVKKVAKKVTKKIRCAGKTKAGKRCKRFTNGKSKFCSAHKRKK